MQIAVLGPVEVHRDGELLDLGAPKRRRLLTALVLGGGRPVSVDALIDLLWGDTPTPGAMTSLQAYVSGMRKVLEPQRERRSTAQVLVTVAPGYALRLPDEAVDATRFADLVTEQHRRLSLPLLGPAPLSRDDLSAAVTSLEEALGWWRGEPYTELGDTASVLAERGHLQELRVMAMEDRAGALLALGDHATTAAELEALTAAHPLRERLWGLRALALVRAGRQADALEVLGQVREVLAEELGLDPGAELQDLQGRVLRQDAALEWQAPSGAQAARSPQPGRGVVGDAASHATTDGPAVPGQDWPMLGRDEEREQLLACLARALGGQASFAAVTGEPGIGKTRLCAELLVEARRLGARALVGRCSQDDGAPPLYPWLTILRELGTALPELTGDEGGDFGIWEEITRAVHRACEDQPLVLVLDDVHWADTSTLRVLRLLVEASTGQSLLVLATWRDRPTPQGALADVAETLARRHAERLELSGLDDRAVAGIVDAVTSHRPSEDQAAALQRRTDGNPFFLVEYSRLVGRGDALGEVLAEAHPPTAVQEVILRRLERLPGQTRRTLQVAAVVGRAFELSLLARAAAVDEDEVLDLLETAQAVGLVHEDGVDRFRFDHALVRDTLLTQTSTSRLARHHARIAELLARRPGRETETARHWLAAGPSHAAAAWRAAHAAGEVSLRAHAHDEAAELFGHALVAMADDPTAHERDRYDVLTGLATAHRWAGQWADLTATVQQAIDSASLLDDARLLAQAAVLTVRGALWQSAHHGEVHESIVEALRRSLETLPAQDSPLRCRCLVGLALELYYGTGVEERRALTEESLAMARRLGDPELLTDVLLGAVNSLWAPGSAQLRAELSTEALKIALEQDDRHSVVTARTQLSIALAEIGRPDAMWEQYDLVRPIAAAMHLDYALLVLDSMVVPWLAMRGELERCEQMMGDLVEVVARTRLPQAEEAIGGVVAALMMWRGMPLPDEMIAGLDASPLPTNATLAFLMWRGGEHERAREWLRTHPPELDHHDWFSQIVWAFAGAMAAYCEDAELGATTYQLMAPYSGNSCVAGSGVASGPLDAYLAMAAVATGEREVAVRHADVADDLAREWQIPLFSQWWRDQRDLLGI